MDTNRVQEEVKSLIRTTPLSKADFNRICKNDFEQYLIFDNKQRMAYCTACHTRIKGKKYIHNTEGKCPRCHRDVTHKSKGMFSLQATKYIITFHRKSTNRIVAITREVNMRYEKGWWEHIIFGGIDIPTHSEPYAVYIFQKGQLVQEYKWQYYQLWWQLKNKVTLDGIYNSHAEVLVDEKSLLRVVEHSWLKYTESIINRYKEWPEWCLRALEEVNRYPQIEKLEKVGLSNFVDSKIQRQSIINTINWRKSDILGLLRLGNRAELKQFLNSKKTVLVLKLIQTARKERWYMSTKELKNYLALIDYVDEFNLCKGYGIKKYLKYKAVQLEKIENRWQFYNWYTDYMRQAKSLGYDMTKKSVLFPKDLEKSHDRVSKEYREMKDKEAAEKRKSESRKINAIAKKIESKSLKTKEYIIRPVSDLEELMKEGRELNHCVASYANKIIKGQSYIWLVRKMGDMDTPYFTAETDKRGKLIQLRGKHNCIPPEGVEVFVEEWSEQVQRKLKKKGAKSGRGKITQADMQHMQVV